MTGRRHAPLEAKMTGEILMSCIEGRKMRRSNSRIEDQMVLGFQPVNALSYLASPTMQETKVARRKENSSLPSFTFLTTFQSHVSGHSLAKLYCNFSRRYDDPFFAAATVYQFIPAIIYRRGYGLIGLHFLKPSWSERSRRRDPQTYFPIQYAFCMQMVRTVALLEHHVIDREMWMINSVRALLKTREVTTDGTLESNVKIEDQSGFHCTVPGPVELIICRVIQTSTI